MLGDGVLRCDLCDRESDPRARGWRADRTLDPAERPAVQVLCADCAGDLVWLGRRLGTPDEGVPSTPTTQDEDQLRLRDMDRQERALSRRRRRMHRVIDKAQDGTVEVGQEEVELLAVLAVEERELSDRRRALHTLIDRMRRS